MTTYTETISTEVSIDLAKIWQDVVGDYFSECAYWLPAVRYFTGDAHPWKSEEWKPTHRIAFIFENQEGDGYAHKWLTAEDFAKARVALHKSKWTHCGHYGIEVEQTEYGFKGEDDACTTDAIVQTALFGEIIYG